MRLLITSLLLLASVFLGQAVPLDWANPSTNNATVTWPAWTNGLVLRYSIFWTLTTNVDTGTNWVTTTNWQSVADVNSSTTNVVIPTNVVFGSYMTYVITLPGGLKTAPALTNGAPYRFNNVRGVTFTNQPTSP